MNPMESRGAQLWGAEVQSSKKNNAFDVEIDEDAVAALSGICVDAIASDKDFKAAVVIRTRSDPEEEWREITVACVSAGCSENVSLEVPLYRGDKVICRSKGSAKGKIYIFGSVAMVEDIGDVMDPAYAAQLQSMLPEARLALEEEDEEENNEKESDNTGDEHGHTKKSSKEESMEQDSDSKSEEESDGEEDEGVKLLEQKFKSRTINKRKMSESSQTEETSAKKKLKSEVSEETVIKNVQKWIREEGTSIALPDLGSKFVSTYKKGFKKLGFGKSMSKFLQESGEFSVDGGNVKLK